MAKLPSLGDSGTDHKLVLETYPLPGSRREVVTAIERILALGGVQRINIQLNQDIKVGRLVKSDPIAKMMDDAVPVEIADDDLMASARNAEMITFDKDAYSFEYLYLAFAQLTKRRLKPKAILVHTIAELTEWLDLDDNPEELFGVELHQHKEIPDNVMLLLATKLDDPETVVLSLRLEMYTDKSEKKDA